MADVLDRHTHSPLDSAAAVAAAAARPRYGRPRLILLIDDFHFCPAVLFRHWRTRKGTELAPYAASSVNWQHSSDRFHPRCCRPKRPLGICIIGGEETKINSPPPPPKKMKEAAAVPSCTLGG